MFTMYFSVFPEQECWKHWKLTLPQGRLVQTLCCTWGRKRDLLSGLIEDEEGTRDKTYSNIVITEVFRAYNLHWNVWIYVYFVKRWYRGFKDLRIQVCDLFGIHIIQADSTQVSVALSSLLELLVWKDMDNWHNVSLLLTPLKSSGNIIWN